MKVPLFVAVLLLILFVMFGGQLTKGRVWKSMFSLFQLANIAGNNGPGRH